QSRWHRWNSKWSDADGIVDPDTMTLDALKKHLPKQRPYSATALQHFAACPYRFLLSAIHRLESRPKAIVLERLDSLTRGRVLHEIQFLGLSEPHSLQLVPTTPEQHAAVMTLCAHGFG